jgi:hypothetical protein
VAARRNYCLLLLLRAKRRLKAKLPPNPRLLLMPNHLPMPKLLLMPRPLPKETLLLSQCPIPDASSSKKNKKGGKK